MGRNRTRLGLVAAAWVLAGCSAGTTLLNVPGDAFRLDPAGPNLAEPAALDWGTHRFDAPGLSARRRAYLAEIGARQKGRATLATFGLQGVWPQAGGAIWGGTPPGLPVNSLAPGADGVPNALAVSMPGAVAGNRAFLFALTKNGHFIRLDGNATALSPGASHHVVALGDTFTSTSVVVSPAGSRAYALSDGGKLYVLSLDGAPALLNPGGTALGAPAMYLSPSLDPALSAHDDSRDVLFVPLNDGKVFRVEMQPTWTAPLVSATPYNVATAAENLDPAGCDGCADYAGKRLVAPGLAFRGRYFIGDAAGVFHDLDTVTGKHVTYALGTRAAIAAPPALEVQDGAASYTDPQRNRVNVPHFDPVHAFVNVTREAGPVCAWINLAQRTVAFSQPLFVDDTDAATPDAALYGDLRNYQRTTSAAGVLEVPVSGGTGDAVTVARTAGATVGSSGLASSASPLAPSTTGANPGGGTDAFFRVDTSGLPAGARIRRALLRVVQDPLVSSSAVPPRVARVGGYDASGSTGRMPSDSAAVWTSAAGNPLEAGNAPWVYDVSPVSALDGYTEGTGEQLFNHGGEFRFDVTAALAGPVGVNFNAFALTYNDLGSVSYGPGTGDGPRFQAGSGADGPRLRIEYEVPAHTPQFPVETGPVIDALRKRVYVHVSNYLYCLKFDDPGRWSDTTVDGIPHTTYQAAFLARTIGARDDGDDNRYVRNRVTPVPAFDLSAIYVMSHGRNGTAYDLAVSKIQPERSGALPDANDIGGSQGDRAVDRTAGRQVSTSVAGTLHGGAVASPYGSRFMLIDPYRDVYTKGGDLYFGLSDPAKLYRIGTDN